MTGPSNPIENPTPHPTSKPGGLTRDQGVECSSPSWQAIKIKMLALIRWPFFFANIAIGTGKVQT